MEENQTNQNLNQQPVQPQPEQVQQPVQWQPVQQQPAEQPSVSMQIQQLLVQQQQYQKQYNELVDYVKKTPNLPIEQVNQIKAQLDQLNALFVEWKQKLQSLWYTQVQVNKPTEIKKWSVTNFSRKKVAIWCGIVLILILAWFLVTLSSLIKNPNALLWIWVEASTAKMLLQAFTGLLFWSLIILMLWVIISNIYRLITVKNQWKWKFIRWLIWWVIWAWTVWALMWIVFWWIWKIETELKNDFDIIQPYLVWRVEDEWTDEFLHPYNNENMEGIGENYPLIAPAEIAYSLRQDKLLELTNSELPWGYEIVDVRLLCGNKDETSLDLNFNETDRYWRYKFWWTCLYSEKWTYTYSIEITYDNTISKERKTVQYNLESLDFTSEVSIYKIDRTGGSSSNTVNKISSENGEFRLWKAPAKVTIDTNQVFRDFSTKWYEVEWDMDGDFVSDRINQSNFDYLYKMPQVYYVTYKFPEIKDDVRYRFPVRVEQSDVPICEVNIDRFPWSNKFQIVTNFIDGTSSSTISSYKYTIRNRATNQVLKELKEEGQKVVYEFPDKWNYVVVVDYVTVDSKQWQCESDLIQLEKEEFNVQYSLQEKDSDSWKFDDICNSQSSDKNNCTEINLESVPQTYQLKIQSISPSTNDLSKAVYFEEATEWSKNTHALMEDKNTYEFTVPDEWIYELRIIVSDKSSWISDATKVIKFTAKKADIVGNLSIMSSESDTKERKSISEWFSPLTVILDASKTEINIPWDEIVYFTWDFWDGEVKKNQQNWVVVHTYNYDYSKENGIFTPKVTVTTLKWQTKVITGPKLHVKKWLVTLDLQSISHPSRQAPNNTNVSFLAEFDWLPETMTRDFWDGTPTYTCQWRACAETEHFFTKQWIFTIKVSLDFDEIQQVEKTMDFKIY